MQVSSLSVMLYLDSHLLLSANAHSAPAAIDRYFLLAGRSAANLPVAVGAVDQWDRQTDRQTDGRTPDRYIDPAPRAMRAAYVCLFARLSVATIDLCGSVRRVCC